MPRIDLNSDVGEELYPQTEIRLLNQMSSANVACGGHAGNQKSMSETIRRCLGLGIRIGAHPSYPDPVGFGRVRVSMSLSDLEKSVLDQVETLVLIASSQDARVAYLKPHGALYSDAAADDAISQALVRVAVRSGLELMGLPDSALERSARANSIGFIREGFADRRYLSDGRLSPRSESGAVISDPEEAASQALRLASEVDSICIHSDTPGAPEIAAAVRKRLIQKGWEIGA